MAGIPEQIIERIRESVDIADIVGGHVGLKRSGKQFKGLCPFHDEKSPSFYVDPVRRSFKCFGCGAWGDVFDFVQKVEGVGFLSAVRTLGNRVGVALPDQTTGDVHRAEARERERESAYRVNAAAAELYRRLLTDSPLGEAGRQYQTERAIDAQIAESFSVGYAPAPEEAGWDTLVRELQSRELPLEMAETLGLVVRSPRSGSYYDRFRGRLMFPIIQPGGRVLGFSGRILPKFAETDDGQKSPKYINSPESLLYKKSRTLFGLHAGASNMRQRERGILVEGQIDVVAMHQRGYCETVAPLGTALTKPQCELLARFTTTIVLCFDGDQAGAKAVYAALPLLLEAGMDVRIAALQPGEDPDSTPPEQLDNLLRAPGSALEWLMKRMVAKGAGQSIDAQARALRALVPLLRCVRGRDARGDYANLAANLLQIPARRVWVAVEGKAGLGGEDEGGGRARQAGGPGRKGGGPGRQGAKGQRDRPWKSSGSSSGADQRRSAGSNSRWGSNSNSKFGSNSNSKFGSNNTGSNARSGFVAGPQPSFEPSFEPSFDSGPGPSFDPSFDPGPVPSFDGGFDPSFDPDFDSDFVPPDESGVDPGPGWQSGPNPSRSSGAGSSQFSAGMPHSAAMRPVQPLPSGQASVTALLVDRPELARVAEREGVLDRVTDQRLHPIVARVIRAALEGEPIPSEGELLELVDPGQHRMLHDLVFGHDYLETEDPQAVLERSLILCERDSLDHEIRSLEATIAEARSRGDLDSVRELIIKRMAAAQRKQELQASQHRA